MNENKLNPSTTFQEVLGQVIIKVRKEMEMKQFDLASKIKITQTTLSKIEQGKSALSVTQLFKLSEVLRIKSSTILSEVERSIISLKSQGVILEIDKEQKTSTAGVAIGAAALGALIGFALGDKPSNDD